MQVTPAPSASRGEPTLQPAYFTSSLFVHPLREDIVALIHLFLDQYTQRYLERPYALFKETWCSQGWHWFHFKVLDARSRDAFLNVTMRLFLERVAITEAPLCRVVALFGLYTFHQTQPYAPAPPLHPASHIAIPLDIYTSLLELPNTLDALHLTPFRPQTICILKTLLGARVFHVVPASTFQALNPRDLPREFFVPDCEVQESSGTTDYGQATIGTGAIPALASDAPKKKGRPSKRDKVRKAKDGLVKLERWLDETAHTLPDPHPRFDGLTPEPAPTPITTHILLSNPPSTSREAYREHKSALLGSIEPEALIHANQTVLARMRRIDQLAAEKGLEVGGEGGDRTGLARVENAVKALRKGGLVGLLEGAGLEDDG